MFKCCGRRFQTQQALGSHRAYLHGRKAKANGHAKRKSGSDRPLVMPDARKILTAERGRLLSKLAEIDAVLA